MARQRIFDVDEAVEKATTLFWRNGYERTSLSDLTSAMGITPPSFYFAFGSKDALFRRVIENYLVTRVGRAEAALNEPTVRTAIEQMLLRLADLYSDPATPRGCLLVNNGLTVTCAGDTLPALKGLHEVALQRKQRLHDRLARAQAEGDLPATCDLDALSQYILVVGWGLATAALHGASRETLRNTIAIALSAWPA